MQCPIWLYFCSSLNSWFPGMYKYCIRLFAYTIYPPIISSHIFVLTQMYQSIYLSFFYSTDYFLGPLIWPFLLSHSFILFWFLFYRCIYGFMFLFNSVIYILLLLCLCILFVRATRWRSWLRHCATSQKVAGSIPIVSLEFFIDIILPTEI